MGSVKYLTYAQKSLLMDDDTAEWLLEYARALGTIDGTDTVKLAAISPSGHQIEVTLLLNRGSELMMESADDSIAAPVNDEAVRYMQDRTRLIVSPPSVQPEL